MSGQFFSCKELYDKLGENYDDVMHRFLKNEGLIYKFVLQFEQVEAFNEFVALAAGANSMSDVAEEMRFFAHTLKGVAMNMGFSKLGKLCDEFCKSVMHEDLPNIDELYNSICVEYKKIIAQIEKFKNC